MPASDTLLSIVAFRLAVAVLICVAGILLPARAKPPRVCAPARTTVAAPPARTGAYAYAPAVREMLSHD